MAKRRWHGKWGGLARDERVRVLLSAIKGGGRTIKQLADYLDSHPAIVEELLVLQRDLEPLVPPRPRPPRLTAKQELFLKRQGNLF